MVAVVVVGAGAGAAAGGGDSGWWWLWVGERVLFLSEGMVEEGLVVVGVVEV